MILRNDKGSWSFFPTAATCHKMIMFYLYQRGPVSGTFFNVTLESKMINFEDWVTHRFKLNEIQKAFDTTNNPLVNKMKIIIEI